MNRNRIRVRERRLSGVLLVVAAVILVCGLVLQISMRVRISGQSKEIAAVQSEITQLDCTRSNLDMNINQMHDLDEIGRQAILLGMVQPDDSQLRSVRVATVGDTSAQSVENVGGNIQG